MPRSGSIPALGSEPGSVLSRSPEWEQVVADFRRVCVLRREGRLEEAQRVLDQDLPQSIAFWSREQRGESAAKKLKLQEMFEFERRRLEDTWAMQRVIREQVKAQVMEEVRTSMAADLEKQARAWFESWVKLQPAPIPASIPNLSTTSVSVDEPTLHTVLPVEAPAALPVAANLLPSVPKAPAPPTPKLAQEVFQTVNLPTTKPGERPGFDDIAGVLDWVLAEQGETTASESASKRRSTVSHATQQQVLA